MRAHVALLAVVVTVHLIGAEGLVSSPERASGQGGIDAARKDFEIVKATKANAPEAKPESPHMDAPEMLALEGVNGGRAPILGKSGGINGGKLKKENWLSDGFFNERETTAAEIPLEESVPGRTPSAGVLDARLSFGAPLPALAAGNGRSQSTNSRSEKSAPVRSDFTAPPNPLAAYMGSWMTSADYKLLQSAKISGGVGVTGMEPGAGFASALPSSGVSPEPAASDFARLGRAGDAGFVGAVRANPYLANELDSKSALPAPMARAVPAPSLAPTFVPASAPPRNSAPVLARPTDDDIYFKGLKRF